MTTAAFCFRHCRVFQNIQRNEANMTCKKNHPELLSHFEAAFDVDSEHTGRYRVTLDDKSTFLIHTPDLGWIEEEHGVTELSKKVGYMIENHEA